MHDLTEEKDIVSIIMPAYNAEKYIKEAIFSVIAQTYKKWELLVVDDASDDNTANIVKNIAGMDQRIKLHRNTENKGVSYSRNKAISLSSGKWIAFLDSDDIWNVNKLEKQCEMTKNKKISFVFTGASYINEEGDEYPGYFNVPNKVNFNMLKRQNYISCSSVLIHKNHIAEVKMENDQIHEDYALWLKILKNGVTAYGLNEQLLIYRISKNSKSGNKLKSFKMTYGVFTHIGLNRLESIYYTFRHLSAAFVKYIKIGKVKHKMD